MQCDHNRGSSRSKLVLHYMPVCFRTVYTSGDKWACPSDGYYDIPKYMYRVVATIKDSRGTTALATMFNNAVKALLRRESSDVVTKEVIPMLIESIQGKEIKFYLQAQKDKRSGNLKCTVNRIIEVDVPTPSSPAHSINPHTPLQKPPATTVASATKRTLFQSPGTTLFQNPFSYFALKYFIITSQM
ncbi:putative nucleic acid-binding protein [Helianthus annuus]|nr:putative nucleic acid-binding protein [Helianthus annuus]